MQHLTPRPAFISQPNSFVNNEHSPAASKIVSVVDFHFFKVVIVCFKPLSIITQNELSESCQHRQLPNPAYGTAAKQVELY